MTEEAVGQNQCADKPNPKRTTYTKNVREKQRNLRALWRVNGLLTSKVSPLAWHATWITILMLTILAVVLVINRIFTKTTKIPTIVWATYEYYHKEPGDPLKCLHEGEFLECNLLKQRSGPTTGADAYMFYATLIYTWPLPREPSVIWALLHEESPRNNMKLMSEKGLNLFNFSATYSRHSDVPYPLHCLDNIDYITDTKHFVETKEKNKLLGELAPVLYLQSNCQTSTERDEYVKELMKYIKVDSYGLCLHNKDLPLDKEFQPSPERKYLEKLDAEELLEIIKWYKFVIAIENGVCKDYLTEKLWRALRTGVVPIYLGAEDVRDWLPHPNAAILLEDYRTPAIMAARLHELNNNDTLYDLHLDHKINRRILNERLTDEYDKNTYQFEFKEIIIRLACVVCQRLHEKSDRVDIVTKKHFDCPEPISALTLAKSSDNQVKTFGWWDEQNLDDLYRMIYETRNSTNKTIFYYENVSP